MIFCFATCNFTHSFLFCGSYSIVVTFLQTFAHLSVACLFRKSIDLLICILRLCVRESDQIVKLLSLRVGVFLIRWVSVHNHEVLHLWSTTSWLAVALENNFLNSAKVLCCWWHTLAHLVLWAASHLVSELHFWGHLLVHLILSPLFAPASFSLPWIGCVVHSVWHDELMWVYVCLWHWLTCVVPHKLWSCLCCMILRVNVVLRNSLIDHPLQDLVDVSLVAHGNSTLINLLFSIHYLFSSVLIAIASLPVVHERRVDVVFGLPLHLRRILAFVVFLREIQIFFLRLHWR